MAITAYEQSALSISTTAISLTVGTSSIATRTDFVIAQLICDNVNVGAADFFEVKLHEKAKSGGTQRTFSFCPYSGAQNGPWVFPSFILTNGWDFSMVKLSGTDRTFDTSIRTSIVVNNDKYESSQTVGTTPCSFVNGNTSIATSQDNAFVQGFVDATNMVAGDVYEGRMAEKVRSGGSQKTVSLGVYTGAQSSPLIILPAVELFNGWDLEWVKLAGTDHSFDLSARVAML